MRIGRGLGRGQNRLWRCREKNERPAIDGQVGGRALCGCWVIIASLLGPPVARRAVRIPIPAPARCQHPIPRRFDANPGA